jgi:hypothetical protein
VGIAGEADGGYPGGALVQQNNEEKQMQDDGRGGVLRAAGRRCHWFAYGVDVCFLLLPAFGFLLKQDSRRLLLIRHII